MRELGPTAAALEQAVARVLGSEPPLSERIRLRELQQAFVRCRVMAKKAWVSSGVGIRSWAVRTWGPGGHVAEGDCRGGRADGGKQCGRSADEQHGIARGPAPDQAASMARALRAVALPRIPQVAHRESCLFTKPPSVCPSRWAGPVWRVLYAAAAGPCRGGGAPRAVPPGLPLAALLHRVRRAAAAWRPSQQLCPAACLHPLPAAARPAAAPAAGRTGRGGGSRQRQRGLCRRRWGQPGGSGGQPQRGRAPCGHPPAGRAAAGVG